MSFPGCVCGIFKCPKHTNSSLLPLQAADSDFIFHTDDFFLGQVVVWQDSEHLECSRVLATDTIQFDQLVPAGVNFRQLCQIFQRLQRADFVVLKIQLLKVFEIFYACQAFDLVVKYEQALQLMQCG